jgi:steroid delta-isomerase-like uncharacterized protein
MANSDATSAEQPGWLRSYVEAWNAHDVPAVLELMTDDVVWVDGALGERVEGAGAVGEFFGTMETTLSSDYHMEVGQSIWDEGAYAFEWTLSGTNDRPDPQHGLPATGQHFEMPGVSIGILRGGMIAENKDYWNLAGYLMQVGLMPSPEATAQPTA